MIFLKALKDQNVVVGSKIANKDELLQKIAALAVENPSLSKIKPTLIYDALAEREKLGSTGFENGIAIPHCRLKNIKEFVVGLITLPEGLDFDAADGKPTKLCFFIIGPAEMTKEHMCFLSIIARTCKVEGAIDKIVASKTADDALTLFINSIPEKIKINQSDEKNKITIYIQREPAFLPILELLTASSAMGISVVSGNPPSKHLYKLPIFSTFWTSEEETFHEVITAVISRKFSNQLLREIEVIVDQNDAKNEVMIVVQEIDFCSGSLSS